MSSRSLIILLALYPIATIIAPLGYFLLFPEEIRLLASLPLSPTDQEERAAATRLGVNVPLSLYGILLGCLILWFWSSRAAFVLSGLIPKVWVSGAFRGAYFGLSWAGVWLWLWLILANARSLRRDVPGFGARFGKQITVLVVGALCEESWRVLCISGLVSHGYSVGFAIAVTALAYALPFLENGLERSVLAALEGSIFGMLFVWQRSFVAPFAAHLAVQAVYLWGVGQFSPEEQRKPWMRGIRCPICKAQLSRFQIKIREPFECASCHEQISVSDAYRSAMRWVGLSAYLVLYACTVVLLDKEVSDTVFTWLVWPVAFGVGTSGFLLYQRIFPPRLQYGSPTFITLGLEHHHSGVNQSTDEPDTGRTAAIKQRGKCPNCNASLRPWETRGAGNFPCPYCEIQLEAAESYGHWISFGNLALSTAIFFALGFKGLHLVYAVLLAWWPIEFIAVNSLPWLLPPKIQIARPRKRLRDTLRQIRGRTELNLRDKKPR